MNIQIEKNRIRQLNIHESRHSERRDAMVSGRFTETQRRQLEKTADDMGVSLSELVNQAATFWLDFYPHNIDMIRNRAVIMAVLGNVNSRIAV